MSNDESVRMTITIEAEWRAELDRLKKEKFWNGTKADVIRYVMNLGLEANKKQETG